MKTFSGGRCYGYDVVQERDAAGEPVRGKRRINPDEAAIVRRIFALSRRQEPEAGSPWSSTVEAVVLEGLKTRLMDPALFKVFAQEFLAEVNRLRGSESAKSEQLKREQDRVEKRIRRIVEAIAEGVPARSLKDELLALEQRQDELEREIVRAPEVQPLLHPNLAELHRQKVAALEEALANPEEGAQAMELIRLVIDALGLTPEGASCGSTSRASSPPSSALPRKTKGPVRRTRPVQRK